MKFFNRLLIALVLSFSFVNLAHAELIWKQANNPANYVVLEKAKGNIAEESVINHPYSFDPKKLTDMLLSLRYNKALAFRKDLEDRQVFFDADTLENKFVPHIVEAFQKASPEQVVVFSIVQKDPYFIVRNDRLNVVRAYVAQDGLHVTFIKTDAKLLGDYQAHMTGAKKIEQAKGLGITLEPQSGQKLSFNDTREIILDLNYDFASLVDKKADEEEAKEKDTKNKNRRSNKDAKDASTAQASPSTSAVPAKSPTERLVELKKLKDQGLISASEYEAKKKEILKDL
ncbi:MAG: SHOCT domain-containing protein [Deltaproteobacteria bacterium]|nr:SHOCT domain-containing protein [Deltaproteobacteria bacterium]